MVGLKLNVPDVRGIAHQCCTDMVFRFSYLPQCSTKSMFYMLFSISLYVILHVWTLQLTLSYEDNRDPEISAIKVVNHRLNPVSSLQKKRIKYILVWNGNYLIINEKNGSIFPSLNCLVKNCFFTSDKKMFGNYTKFHAIIFNEQFLESEDRPKERNPSQLFVFTTIESSYNYAACELHNDNFFNWTFTYRLDSDIVWNYFVVRDASGSIVAPSADVEWEESSRPLKPQIKSILRRKRKTAAWIVSNCDADSLREDYLMVLQHHLSHFSLKIDVYGKCSKVNCTNNNCDDMLTRNYRFYMAFENSMAEDYVTEKVLHGYRNYAVPVVYGGANYTRFLPAGSYINAREMHPYNLAFTIYEATRSAKVFESYFGWTNLYTINSWGQKYHPLCDLCEALNDEITETPAIENFRVWWNTLNGMKWCLPREFWLERGIVNVGERIYNQY